MPPLMRPAVLLHSFRTEKGNPLRTIEHVLSPCQTFLKAAVCIDAMQKMAQFDEFAKNILSFVNGVTC